MSRRGLVARGFARRAAPHRRRHVAQALPVRVL